MEIDFNIFQNLTSGYLFVKFCKLDIQNFKKCRLVPNIL